MLGYKAREFKQHESISLENLVPEDNFYRQVERTINLSFVCDLTNDFYSKIGRPSIDPVVFFKLQLIAFFEGKKKREEVQLVKEKHGTDGEKTLDAKIEVRFEGRAFCDKWKIPQQNTIYNKDCAEQPKIWMGVLYEYDYPAYGDRDPYCKTHNDKCQRVGGGAGYFH